MIPQITEQGSFVVLPIMFFISAFVVGLIYSCLYTSPEMTCFTSPIIESRKPRLSPIVNR